MTAVIQPISLSGRSEMISLQQLTTDLVNSFSLPALRNRNILVNNITENLLIGSNPHVIASILSGILSTVINHSKNTSISLSIKLCGEVVLIHIKDDNNFAGYTLDNRFQQIQALAGKIGGFISITNQRQDVTAITLSFPNLPIAA
jgi:hypothetical protein